MKVEFAFYVFFGLSLLCILAVLFAEHLRAAGRTAAAIHFEHWTKVVFAVAVLAVVGAAIALSIAPGHAIAAS